MFFDHNFWSEKLFSRCLTYVIWKIYSHISDSRPLQPKKLFSTSKNLFEKQLFLKRASLRLNPRCVNRILVIIWIQYLPWNHVKRSSYRFIHDTLIITKIYWNERWTQRSPNSQKMKFSSSSENCWLNSSFTFETLFRNEFIRWRCIVVI